jgi:hypothetical protein
LAERPKRPLRYYDLAQADLEAAQGPTSIEVLGHPGFRMGSPLLPLAPAGAEKPTPHLLVRAILEDLATAPNSEVPEPYRLRYLAILDSLTVIDRQGLGEFMLQSMKDVTDEASPDGASWRFRTIITPGPPDPPSLHLGFAACSREHGEYIVGAFEGWIRLRRHDIVQAFDDPRLPLTTIGVLVTPKPGVEEGWDTTLMSATEWPELEAQEIANLRQLYPHRPA